MKKIITGIMLLTLTVFVIARDDQQAPTDKLPKTNDYTVHEWGTFTSVSSSDGRLMDGLYLEEEKLPGFVHQFGEKNAVPL